MVKPLSLAYLRLDVNQLRVTIVINCTLYVDVSFFVLNRTKEALCSLAQCLFGWIAQLLSLASSLLGQYSSRLWVALPTHQRYNTA